MATTSKTDRQPAARGRSSGALEVMLSDAAVGTPRFLAPRAAAKVAAALARDPAALVRRARG
jgi:hypothetical protein